VPKFMPWSETALPPVEGTLYGAKVVTAGASNVKSATKEPLCACTPPPTRTDVSMSEPVALSVRHVSDELVIHDVVWHTLSNVIVAHGSALPKFMPAIVVEAPPVYGPFAASISANDVTGPAARRVANGHPRDQTRRHAQG
jgi:hypothetical protein